MPLLINKSDEIVTSSLPEDLIVFVMQVVEELADKDLPKSLPYREVPIEDFPLVDINVAKTDERGLSYAMDMIGVAGLPPLVSVGNLLIDGRHRLHAARCENKSALLVIDLSKWIKKNQVPEFLNLGEIIPGQYLSWTNQEEPEDLFTVKNHPYATLLAQHYIDAAPDEVMSASEYTWQFHQVSVTTLMSMMFPGSCDRDFENHARNVDLDPDQSDLSRPIVISHSEMHRDGRHADEMRLWDGVHRILSAWKLGIETLPAAVGIPPGDHQYCESLREQDLDSLGSSEERKMQGELYLDQHRSLLTIGNNKKPKPYPR